MMQPEPDTSTLPIAYCPGSLTHPFTTALAMQREEEPETPARLIETDILDQASGLEEGRYCVGLSFEEHASLALASTARPLPQSRRSSRGRAAGSPCGRWPARRRS